MRTKFKQWAVDLLHQHLEFVLDKIDLNNDSTTKSLDILNTLLLNNIKYKE